MSDLGSTVPVREGLPANYRMRADAHYVDQLVAPGVRRAADEDTKPPATPPKMAAAAAAAPTRGDGVMLNEDDLAKSLGAVLSCTDLLADGMPRLTRSVAIDMIRAETQRTICALRAAHVLRHGVPHERRLVEPRSVIERTAETVASEARLRGSRLHVSTELAGSARIRGDEPSLVTALASIVVMLSAGLHDVQGAKLDLKVSGNGSGRVTFAVVQESVILPDNYLKVANAIEPASTPETTPLVALRQVAEAHGGCVTVSRLPHGTEVSIELPVDGH